ncbi:hypothetical protein HZB94_04065 [Candidatus Falkowbacteria bacterium]|nr:hypothetical protein [Candidatus Falkowbacteria bacterium]
MVCPLSILEIRGKVFSDLSEQILFYSEKWYDNESFANNRGKVGWHLVRKTPVENSTDKTWDEQQALLAKNEEMPTALVMVYTIISHFLATGERLFENVYVCCSDMISGGCRVCVGDFNAGGLSVVDYKNTDHGLISIAASRLPEKL